MSKIRHLIDRLFRNSEGSIVLWQMPNIWLWLWILATLANYIVSEGLLTLLLQALSMASIIIWSFLEIYSGVTPFRRIIGSILVAVILIRIV